MFSTSANYSNDIFAVRWEWKILTINNKLIWFSGERVLVPAEAENHLYNIHNQWDGVKKRGRDDKVKQL